MGMKTMASKYFSPSFSRDIQIEIMQPKPTSMTQKNHDPNFSLAPPSKIPGSRLNRTADPILINTTAVDPNNALKTAYGTHISVSAGALIWSEAWHRVHVRLALAYYACLWPKWVYLGLVVTFC